MTAISLSDGTSLRGDVKIVSIDDSGSESVLVDDKNLIVISGRLALANLLAGTLASSAIQDIAFGDGGVLINNSSIAVAVNPEDTVVNKRITAIRELDYTFRVAVAGTTASPKLVCSVTVPKVPVGFTTGDSTTAGLNGKSISELALMMQNGSAFSIKRFPAIPKSNSISLVISWTIYF